MWLIIGTIALVILLDWGIYWLKQQYTQPTVIQVWTDIAQTRAEMKAHLDTTSAKDADDIAEMCRQYYPELMPTPTT